MKHNIILIGWIGHKQAYLDVSQEEAIKRYERNNHIDSMTTIETIEFDDEFVVYDAWEA